MSRTPPCCVNVWLFNFLCYWPSDRKASRMREEMSSVFEKITKEMTIWIDSTNRCCLNSKMPNSCAHLFADALEDAHPRLRGHQGPGGHFLVSTYTTSYKAGTQWVPTVTKIGSNLLHLENALHCRGKRMLILKPGWGAFTSITCGCWWIWVSWSLPAGDKDFLIFLRS